MSKTFIRYAAAILVALVFSLLLLIYFGAFRTNDTALLFKYLSDAFLAPATVYLGISALCAIATTGAFDLFKYSIRNFFRLFRKNMEDEHLPKDFYEYYTAQRQKQFGAWHLLYTGIGLFALSLIFTFVYISL